MASNSTRGAAIGAASGAASGAMVGGPWGAAIGGVVGGVQGLMSGSAADEAEELAKEQAKFVQMQTDENVYQMRKQAQQQLGEATAVVGQSNIQMSGSSQRYVNELRASWQHDIGWTAWSGAQQAKFTRQQGQDVSSSIMTGLYTQQAGQLLTSAASYAAAGGFSPDTQMSPNATGSYMSTKGPSSSGNVMSNHINPANGPKLPSPV